MLRGFSLRDFGASLNTAESYTNESSQGKIGLCETANKQKCTHLGIFLASEYDRILSQLNDPNIDLQTYNRLVKEFQTLRLEINKADKAGKNLWQTFKEKLTKFTGWMSMTYAVTLFTSNVGSAVSELKEMDSILTEISKTSNRTEESLKKLGKDSFTTASKYGRTASDYLIGVQEMSRAGFGEKESEQMAELSILAQSAGDMTAELANEYLIATNAGYQLGGSAEKLNSVLD